MSSAESLSGPTDLSDREREAVELLLRRLADDEFVLADRYTEWQVRAPTIESDIAIANIAQDELGHARLWYDLLEDFGYTEPDLLWERDPATFRHSTLVELPFAEGDWADCVVRSYLYDEAEFLRLNALAESSYPRIRDRVAKVLGEEDYHREHATNWLRRLVASEKGRRRVQAATDRLFPYALTLFEPAADAAETEAAVDELGVRTRTLADLRAEWMERVTETMADVGIDLRAPEVGSDGRLDADALPDHVGRDGDHTDHWGVLYDDFTEAYREMGLHEAPRFMKDPDDV
jgi:ring-1,2-phenylacetyl-CoA epoxidase subunit PaaC